MTNDLIAPYYRELLSRELESRSACNPRYSLRSFARDLKLSPQRLSDLIRGRYGLSAIQARSIADELGLAPDEQKRFISSAEMLHSRSPLKRKMAREEFESLKQEYSTLSIDLFQVISEWYHYAILELTYVKGFQSKISWIAKYLGISEFTVEKAIERLRRLELLGIDKNGRMKCTKEFVMTPSGVPSEAIRKFHRQLLEKAIQALDLQTINERDMASVIMAIDCNRLDEAKEDLKRYRREFTKKYGSDPKQNEVYCLGIQFFRLQTKRTGSEI